MDVAEPPRALQSRRRGAAAAAVAAAGAAVAARAAEERRRAHRPIRAVPAGGDVRGGLGGVRDHPAGGVEEAEEGGAGAAVEVRFYEYQRDRLKVSKVDGNLHNTRRRDARGNRRWPPPPSP